MEQSWIDPVVWVVLGIICLGALVTGIGLILKSLSFQSQYLQSLLVGLFGTIVFTAAGLLIPLAFFSGKDYQQDHLLADLLMFGISGLVLVGIFCFIVDHLNEKPNFLMLAAAASLGVALFPWVYIVFHKDLNAGFQIAIVQPELPVPKGLDPLVGDRVSLEASSETDKPDQEMGGQASKGSFSPFAPPPVPAPSLLKDGSTTAGSSQSEGSATDWLYDDP